MPTLFMPDDDACAAKPPGIATRVVGQLAVIALLFACIGGSVIPAALVHSALMDTASKLWVIQGRAGPAIILAIVVWLACYTLLAIALKWLLVGRQRAGVLKPRGSPPHRKP